MSATGQAPMMGAPASMPSDTAPIDGPVDDMAEDEPVDENEPIVLCTVMFNPADGTFTLVKGDEGDAGAEDGMSGEAAEGMPPAAGGVAAQPAGQTFDAPGPLLKAVLDILKDAEEQSGGSAEKNFDQGFEQKY